MADDLTLRTLDQVLDALPRERREKIEERADDLAFQAAFHELIDARNRDLVVGTEHQLTDPAEYARLRRVAPQPHRKHEWQDCPDCKGTGKGRGAFTRCAECYGHGGWDAEIIAED